MSPFLCFMGVGVKCEGDNNVLDNQPYRKTQCTCTTTFGK